MKRTISIVIPAYNESDVIMQLASALIKTMNAIPKYAFEVIVVEHGSTDNTLEQLLKARKKDNRIKILQLAKNVGCDGGIIAGLTYATGDAAIVMMADLQDDLKVIPQFIKKWEDGYDVVYAIIKKRTHVMLYKQFGAKVFYKMMDILSKGLIPVDVSDFRLLDKDVYQAIITMPEHNKFFRGLVAWSGFRQTGISTIRLERAAGTPKSDLKTLIKVAFTGMFSFSNLPLRISWLLSIVYLLAGLLSLLLSNNIAGILLISFAILAALIGIQGEYMIKILEETRGRPNFIVRETYGVKI